MTLSRSSMNRALRSVPIVLRREWIRAHGGCPTCLAAGRSADKANACARTPHLWDVDRLTAAYTDLVVNRPQGETTPTDSAALSGLLDRVRALEAKKARVVLHEIQVGTGPRIELPKGEVVHQAFDEVMGCVMAGLPILLVGPTGSGKSQLARSVARALARMEGRDATKFRFNAVTAGISEGVITGRLLPTGEHARMEYARSEFVAAYEDGDLYLADEFDAIDPNVALIFNDALANGHASVPHRVDRPYAVRHTNFVFIAAANTFGTGADRQYTGRAQLDGATLGRFDTTTVEVGYDPDLEAQVIPGDILAWIKTVRSLITEHRLRKTCSTRTGVSAKRLEAVGVKRETWVRRYFSPWSREELSKVPANVLRGEVY